MIKNSKVPDIPYLISKIIYGIGAVVEADDINDWGKFDHLHHWFIGALIKEFGKNLGGLSIALNVFQNLKENITKEKIFPFTKEEEVIINALYNKRKGSR